MAERQPTPALKSCPVCGKPARRTYCSQTCHAATRKKGRMRTCPICGVLFYLCEAARRRSSRRGGRNFYCSRQCRGKSMVRQLVPRTESLCVTCKEIKPASSFYKDRKAKLNGGLSYSCRDCIKKKHAAYYDANADKAIRRSQKYRREHPEADRRRGAIYRLKIAKVHLAARRAVNAAVRKGLLVRPDACEKCGRTTLLFGHHHKGYGRAHWLHVLWVCSSCHHAEHGRGPQTRKDS